jgi:hypothetical protein
VGAGRYRHRPLRPSFGSYNQIVNEQTAAFTIDGADTRQLMIRQVWPDRGIGPARAAPAIAAATMTKILPLPAGNLRCA